MTYIIILIHYHFTIRVEVSQQSTIYSAMIMYTEEYQGIFVFLFGLIFFGSAAYGLRESCLQHFEGFLLPKNYNPNAPPAVKSLTIHNKVIVREISKVM